MSVSYAKSRGYPETDWHRVLECPPEPHGTEHRKLIKRAGDFKTCATGMLPVELPRRNGGAEPMDHDLSVAGGDFYCWVTVAHWSNARSCLNKIHSRASQILKEIKES